MLLSSRSLSLVAHHLRYKNNIKPKTEQKCASVGFRDLRHFLFVTISLLNFEVKTWFSCYHK